MRNIKFIFFLFFITPFLSTTLSAEKNYFSEGEKLFKKKNFIKSKFQFEKDIVFNPKNEKSYLYLAKIYKLEKKDEFEEQNLKTVILLDPKNEEAIYLLTLLKIKQSNYEKSNQLIKNFEAVCSKLCDNQKELKEKIKDLQPK